MPHRRTLAQRTLSRFRLVLEGANDRQQDTAFVLSVYWEAVIVVASIYIGVEVVLLIATNVDT